MEYLRARASAPRRVVLAGGLPADATQPSDRLSIGTTSPPAEPETKTEAKKSAKKPAKAAEQPAEPPAQPAEPIARVTAPSSHTRMEPNLPAARPRAKATSAAALIAAYDGAPLAPLPADFVDARRFVAALCAAKARPTAHPPHPRRQRRHPAGAMAAARGPGFGARCHST